MHMIENEMLSPDETNLSCLKQRCVRLSNEKSALQMVVHMMEKIGSASGQQNTVEAMLKSVYDSVESANIALYYVIDNAIHYKDVMGREEVGASIDDFLVKKVFRTGKTLEYESICSGKDIRGAVTCLFPLTFDYNPFGVVKIENLRVESDELKALLPDFFKYFTSVLRNEIINSSILEHSEKMLIEEKSRRIKCENELLEYDREMEKKVACRTAELESRNSQMDKMNKSLEEFNYSVSHDLRAPLRVIDGFSSVLTEEYSSALGPEGEKICSAIRANATRMSHLLDDLLAFSRVGRAEISRTSIDMTSIVFSVFHDLTTMENRERIDFSLDSLPDTEADKSLIIQVWTNLLSNAIKFSSKRERAFVRVGSMSADGEIIYYVKDNGAGFDMSFSDRLFKAFNRLHSNRDFEGSGVGLAIVQKIISCHGGRVWAEGAVDNGAAVYFTVDGRNDAD